LREREREREEEKKKKSKGIELAGLKMENWKKGFHRNLQ
jgi:hypothetical protein